jgi:peptidoglycan/LPS O-acetylase OafA/YrhL
MTNNSTTSHQRFAEIDLLRFFAAISVVAFHYLYRGPAIGAMPGYQFPVIGEWARYGFLGVHLFFMISGFVIAFSIRGRSPGEFLWSRASRLYPAFWFAIVLTTIVVHVAQAHAYQLHWWQVVANFTMLNHLVGIPAVDGVYWSLYVELHFYSLVWLMIRLGQQHRELMLLALWLLVAAVWQAFPVWKVELFLAARYAPFFVAGALICRIRVDGSSATLWSLYGLSWFLSMNIMVGVSPAVQVSQGDNPTVIAALITAAFLLMAGIGLGFFAWITGSVVALLGTLTYPLYLLHEVVGWVLLTHLSDQWSDTARVGFVTCLMIAGAWLVHSCVERPISRWFKGLRAATKPDVASQHGISSS